MLSKSIFVFYCKFPKNKIKKLIPDIFFHGFILSWPVSFAIKKNLFLKKKINFILTKDDFSLIFKMHFSIAVHNNKMHKIIAYKTYYQHAEV